MQKRFKLSRRNWSIVGKVRSLLPHKVFVNIVLLRWNFQPRKGVVNCQPPAGLERVVCFATRQPWAEYARLAGLADDRQRLTALTRGCVVAATTPAMALAELRFKEKKLQGLRPTMVTFTLRCFPNDAAFLTWSMMVITQGSVESPESRKEWKFNRLTAVSTGSLGVVKLNSTILEA